MWLWFARWPHPRRQVLGGFPASNQALAVWVIRLRLVSPTGWLVVRAIRVVATRRPSTSLLAEPIHERTESVTDRPAPREGSAELAGAARTGFIVNSLATATRNVLEIATSIILARLLLPEEFGVVAVVTMFIGLSWVVGNLGMGGAVIQAEDLTGRDERAAFTLSVSVGVGLTLLLALLSPLVAQYFRFPVLRYAMPVMSIQVLLAGASATPLALLRRRLEFKRLAIVDIGFQQ